MRCPLRGVVAAVWQWTAALSPRFVEYGSDRIGQIQTAHGGLHGERQATGGVRVTNVARQTTALRTKNQRVPFGKLRVPQGSPAKLRKIPKIAGVSPLREEFRPIFDDLQVEVLPIVQSRSLDVVLIQLEP